MGMIWRSIGTIFRVAVSNNADSVNTPGPEFAVKQLPSSGFLWTQATIEILTFFPTQRMNPSSENRKWI